MTLIKYKPFGLQDSPAFRSFFDPLPFFEDGFTTRTSDFVPAIDVKENEKHYTLTAEMPGVDEKDIDLSFKDGVVTIAGQKKHESKKEDENHVRVERTYGSFHRSLTLPVAIDEKAVTAKFKNGLLTVTLPKKAEVEQVHKIKIQS
ncbi:MAG: Hsp20/alpha crystallin family protein [Deltaproteobacteria bacterium]|nr:Hsp20/alpha crystallin family protein [Deltaproteobacteria bacterium]